MQKNVSNLTSFGMNFAPEQTQQIACDSIKNEKRGRYNQPRHVFHWNSFGSPSYLPKQCSSTGWSSTSSFLGDDFYYQNTTIKLAFHRHDYNIGICGAYKNKCWFKSWRITSFYIIWLLDGTEQWQTISKHNNNPPLFPSSIFQWIVTDPFDHHGNPQQSTGKHHRCSMDPYE